MSLPIRIPDLLPRIHELAPRAPGEKELWVLLPSFSLLRELSQALLDEGTSFVGLRLLSADMAVQHILECRGLAAPEIMDPLAQADLLLQVLMELREKELGESQAGELAYLLSFPETRHGLLLALTQLRSFGWPNQKPPQLVSTSGRLLYRALILFHQKLEKLSLLDRRALLDLALVALATPCDQDPGHVLIFAPGPRLSGELEALLETFEERTPIEIMTQAPEPQCLLEERAMEFGKRGEEIPPAVPKDCFAIYTAQGELEELREALQRARTLIQDGCPPHRIALVLADPQAYATHLDRLAQEEGLPLEPGFGQALREHPMAALAIRLVQVLAEDLPRKDLLSCLGHPHFHRTEFDFLLQRENLAWLDRITREAACLGGRESISEALHRKREEMARRKADKEQLQRLDELALQLNTLLAEFEAYALRLTKATDHRAQVRELQAFLSLHLAAEGDAVESKRNEILTSFEILHWRDDIGLATLDLQGLVSHCEEILGQEVARHPSFRAGGIRILSLDRFRGLQMDHVFLLGFNRGRFPRKPLTDPWLGEADRVAIRESYYSAERAGQPGLFLAFELAEEGTDIQIQDLASLIGGAAKSFTLSWLRADTAGKQKSPAAWLRFFGRSLAGIDLKDELQGGGWIQHLPWSPERRLVYRQQAGRPLSANEALCLSAFQGSDASLLETASLIHDPRMQALQRAGTERQRLDSFEIGKDPEALSWDALQLGKPARSEESLSVSAFEKLGSCPLSFYLSTLLRARALPEEPLLDGIRMRDLGSALHEVLNHLFAHAEEDGLLEKDPAAAFAKMKDRIGIEIEHQQKRLLSELSRSLEAVKPEYLLSWKKSLEDLLERDLAELMESGYRPRAFEEAVRAEIVLGGGRVGKRRVQIHGRMDRLDGHEDGRLRILDYKSGGKYKPEEKEILSDPFKGKKLQLPLYMLLLLELHPQSRPDSLPEAELRGIAPDALASCRGALPRKRFSDKVLENEEALRERMGILHELLVQGNFPFQSDRQCNYCDFRHGCPRHHRPSQERQGSCSPLDDYREMLSTSKPVVLGARQSEEQA